MSEAAADRPTLAAVVDLLQRAGSQEEPNEEIAGLTILHHGLQCAAHLQGLHTRTTSSSRWPGSSTTSATCWSPGCADIHGAVGADFVRPVFGERVAALVEDHVPAKRYLVTVDPPIGSSCRRAAPGRWPSRARP